MEIFKKFRKAKKEYGYGVIQESLLASVSSTVFIFEF
jgi:hypothetical protein